VGNPIGEVLRKHEAAIRSSAVLGRLGLAPRQYTLATLHRAENVDEPARLYRLLEALELCGAAYELPVIVSVHPRTRERLRNGDAPAAPHVRFEPPFGLFDFVHLEMEAVCVLTDSGTVQEECCLFGVPNVTIRDVTERAETVEAGSNIISGSDPRHVLACVRLALSGGGAWQPPSEYLAPAVAATVARIVLGYEHGLN
jgi:UDP-N-acetylglucosamine 2-epimerase (non-hydrolysing)